ncbi:asparagine synthase (glutamine-hydrolyzing) [candidate division TA06 bacterium]|uniref:asparagine synthase (glutamine-hydrolyzing) n=1 Tax=candidate division TA06 bacterium TaxID=2250710 RepID=A0A933IBE5_UNCT6|nr:asparagine synthase (glutamine-hydrolyzing) [candidate division TA06 bacterium]
MCGICGIVSLGREGPPVDSKELLRIRDRMAVRGPDEAGLWTSPDRKAALGHRRLSIIDLSRQASQPMTDDSGRYAIVFNGEIYNYRDLQRQLSGSGHKFRSNSDTEVLLALYAQMGAGMLDSLRGMFALAIWDDSDKRLFLARDHFGIKPLYYSRDGRYFRFASQVKALLAGGKISSRADQAGQAGFLTLGYVPEPHTTFESIQALPAGTAKMIGRSGRERDIKYFELTNELTGAEVSFKESFQPALPVEELQSAFRDSVNYHLVSDVPVGVFLSSGVDSTTIAALASEHKADIKTVTLGFAEFKGKENDEVPLAEKTAALLETDHTSSWISRSDFTGQLEKLLEAMDQPSIDGVNTYFVSRAASQIGLKVALSGLGGDELCGSYSSFRHIPQMTAWFKGWKDHRKLAGNIRRLASPMLKSFISPKYAGLFEYGGSYGGAYLLRRGLFMPWELPGLMGKDEAERGWADLNLLNRLENAVEPIKAPRLKVAALELSWYMKNQLLKDSDWAGMAHSLEIRAPWVDVKLFRALLPFMARGKVDKTSLLSSVINTLPPEIRSRKRTGFSVPVRNWLMEEIPARRKAWGLRDWARLLHNKWVNI